MLSRTELLPLQIPSSGHKARSFAALPRPEPRSGASSWGSWSMACQWWAVCHSSRSLRSFSNVVCRCSINLPAQNTAKRVVERGSDPRLQTSWSSPGRKRGEPRGLGLEFLPSWCKQLSVLPSVATHEARVEPAPTPLRNAGYGLWAGAVLSAKTPRCTKHDGVPTWGSRRRTPRPTCRTARSGGQDERRVGSAG
jgi:hypothetical protein